LVDVRITGNFKEIPPDSHVGKELHRVCKAPDVGTETLEFIERGRNYHLLSGLVVKTLDFVIQLRKVLELVWIQKAHVLPVNPRMGQGFFYDPDVLPLKKT